MHITLNAYAKTEIICTSTLQTLIMKVSMLGSAHRNVSSLQLEFFTTSASLDTPKSFMWFCLKSSSLRGPGLETRAEAKSATPTSVISHNAILKTQELLEVFAVCRI